tara:strand:+ start:17942 stop:18217 length:276 start_codon:yes stop_codon:yes gene_type:complete
MKPDRELVTKNRLIGEFFSQQPLGVAACILHWMHTLDCSPSARKAIRAGVGMDGSQSHGLGWFDCPTCCDSGRYAKNNKWVSCPDCKHRES